MSDDTPRFMDLGHLWDASAIVLFDWLMEVDMDAVPFSHRTQRQALTDLITIMEETLAAHATEAQVDDAKERMARNM